MSYIARDMAALNGQPVTEAHSRYCREHGHATHRVDGQDTGTCPRCGETTLTATTTTPVPAFLTVAPELFAEAFDFARASSPAVREACSGFTHTAGTRYVLSDDMLSGFAVRADGELVFVFSLKRGRGDALVSAALQCGAQYLDCFDGYLPKLYGRHGFHVDRRESNWTPGGPDVVFMSHTSRFN